MMLYSSMPWKRTCLDWGLPQQGNGPRFHDTHPFLTRYALPIGEAKAVRFERSSQSLGQKHFQFAFSAAPESSGLSCHGREQLAMVS